MKKITSDEINEVSISNYIPRGQLNYKEIEKTVHVIINEVRNNGDDAVKKYTELYDGFNYSDLPIKVNTEEIEQSMQFVDSQLIVALKKAKSNIVKFHTAQLRKEWTIETQQGVKTGQIFRAIQKVGIYVPGGEAVYPSSVLMTSIPAIIAGVKDIVMCSPPQPDGKISPAILAAAGICGIENIYKCGGVQAIAGMALGTETIPQVQKIVGPGNKWVNCAKQILSSECAIDNPAGPSEVLLVVNESTNPLWAAYDLISQSEHGEGNISILLSQNAMILERILENVVKLTETSSRGEIIQRNLEKHGLIILSSNRSESIRVINLIAPEHLHFNIENARSWLPDINNAGAIFLGPNSPVALGDYVAGTNHVLPTSGYARTYSGLSTFDFLKRIDVLESNNHGLQKLFPIMKPIAEFEGLLEHKNSVQIRLLAYNPKESD